MLFFFVSELKYVGNFLKDASNVRSIFEQCAKDHQFDPLIADNWYSIRTEDITAIKVNY